MSWREALFPPIAPEVEGAPDPYAQAPEVPDVDLPLAAWGYGEEPPAEVTEPPPDPQLGVAPTLGHVEAEPMPYELGSTSLEHRAMPSELAGAPATALLDEAASGGQGLGQAVLPDNYGMFGQEGMGPSVAESLGYTSETPIEIAERATQEELGELLCY